MADRFGILCTSIDWAAPPRTAAALTQHGAEVCMVAPPRSYAAATKYKRADIIMPFDQMGPRMPAIARVLAEEFGAHAWLAGDDLAFAMMARLVSHMHEIEFSETTRTMLTRSMPSAHAGKLLASDSDFIVAQQNLSPCPAPPCIANPDESAALAFASEHGYPVVVKRDGFASGHGVTICRSRTALEEALLVRPDNPRNATFVLQKFIDGTVYGATVSGACGRAVAGFSFIKHRCSTENGATSVALHDHREEILRTSYALFEMYGLSGYAGFDFIVEPEGRTYFIEVNPRLMPTGHFTAFGVDLTAAYLAAVRGAPIPQPTAPTHKSVALFPNEWVRDADSPYLRDGLHDVPWHDPPLFAAMVERGLAASTQGERQSWVSYAASPAIMHE